jgi:short subunit dehydrogenase-like uncharacterized protein
MTIAESVIGVYGATGVLGRRVISRLRAAGVQPVLVGRRREPVEQLAASHGSAAFAVAAADDAPALRRALDGCAAVINCAPSAACGEAVVRAALEVRAHYVDPAGDQAFIQRLFDKFSAGAIDRGVVLLPGCGFDYAVGDCLARASADSHEPADDVLVAYCIEGAEVSGNSVRAAVSGPRAREVVYRGGRWRPLPFELDRAAFEFPAPFGHRQMSRYGSGEVITVPRHTRTDRVTTLITSQSLCPSPRLLPLFPVLRPLVGLALRSPARTLVALLSSVGSHGRAASPGPSQPPRFVVVARTRGRDGSLGSATAQGGDFHAVTAAALVFAAVSIARADHAQPGTHSPATAVEPRALLHHLESEGVSWNVC